MMGSYRHNFLFRNRNFIVTVLIVVSSILALALTGYTVFHPVPGITPALPLLFFIPVLLSAYRFPKKGFFVSVALAILYLLLSVTVPGTDITGMIIAAGNAAVLAATGIVVSYLSWDARKQRGQYKDLFDHSEAGSLVLQTGKSGIIINEVNYRAAHILGTDAPDLSGRLFPGLFDNPKDYEKFSRTLEKDGVLYSFGSRLKKTEGEPVDVILSARKMPDARVIVSLVDVTEHKRAEDALHKANAELNFFSRILSDDLLTVTNSLSGIIRDGKKSAVTWESIDVFDRIDRMVYYVGRRLELTKSYQDLGSVPPVWIPVQAGVLEQAARVDLGTIALSVWVERLEIYADGLAKNIFYHLIDNAVWHGKSVTEIVVSSSNSDNGIDLIFEDNGVGIENEKKAALFSYGSDIHAGLGLSIDRKILGITGIAIEETGQPGKGARFEITVPKGVWRFREPKPE